MDTEGLMSLVEDLESNIDDLEEALRPVLKQSLSANTGKLPLLDKAKLYTLTTYAIESVLFSSLRLNGVETKSHPITQELNRVKEYYGKIKAAETATQKRPMTVDKDAAGRFIKAGLAGNDKYDQERKQRQDARKAGAKRKLQDLEASGTHIQFVSDEGEDGSPAGSDRPSKRRLKGDAGREKAKRQRKAEKRAKLESEDDQITQPETTNSAGEGVVAAKARNGRSKKGPQKVPQNGHDTFQRLLNAPESQKRDDSSKKKRHKSSTKEEDEDGGVAV